MPEQPGSRKFLPQSKPLRSVTEKDMGRKSSTVGVLLRGRACTDLMKVPARLGGSRLPHAVSQGEEEHSRDPYLPFRTDHPREPWDRGGASMTFDARRRT